MDPIENVAYATYVAEDTFVGVACRSRLAELVENDWAKTPGLYCLIQGNARHVGASARPSEALENEALDGAWWRVAVLMARPTPALPLHLLAYLEDRLSHMLELEDFEMAPRAPRHHNSLSQQERHEADNFLLTGLELLESNSVSLFSSSGDITSLTVPLWLS